MLRYVPPLIVEMLAPEKCDALACNVNMLLKMFKEFHDLSGRSLSLPEFASITEEAQCEEFRRVGHDIWLIVSEDAFGSEAFL